MEDALVLRSNWTKKQLLKVLILVLMEDALVQNGNNSQNNTNNTS